MQIKTTDGERNVASQGLGVWGAVGGGLGTLALLNQGILGGSGLFGGVNRGAGAAAAVGMTDAVSNHDTRVIGTLQSELAKEKAERYADNVATEVYKEAVSLSNKNDDKINANYKELAQFITALDKQVAVDKKATECNFSFLNNKIDTTANDLRCYVDARFVPGELKMPLDKICPEAMRRYNSWTAPTNQAPDTQPVDVTSQR